MTRVLVLGMHRSGTSLVTRALVDGGLHAGASEDMLSAQADNPLGFYERRDLVEANDALLQAHGGSWFDPPKDPVRDPTERVAGVFDALTRGAGEQEALVLKDPRLCLTWPAWSQAGTLIVYVYRNPLAVADSLRRRNAFPLAYGIALWEYYNRSALAALEEHAGVCLSYDALAGDFGALTTMLRQLRGLGLAVAEAPCAELFDAGLRHAEAEQSFDPAERALLTPEQASLAAHCRARCSGDAGPSLPAPTPSLLPRIRDFARALAPLSRLLETGIERDEALALSSERTQERDRALAGLRGLEKDYASLADAHDAEKKRHERAASTLRSLEDEHARLAAAHHREVKIVEELYEQRDELLLKAAELEVMRDKADYLFYALTESLRMLLTFEQSTMARVQRQARRLYRLLTLQRGRNSAYEDLLERAHEHFETFELALPGRRRTRWSMAGDVIRYVLRNPAGSARSFSWHRLRRAARVFFGSSPDELAVWVNARFPDSIGARVLFSTGVDEERLDSLELRFPELAAPSVSIVIPVFNEYRVTANCLRSLRGAKTAAAFEVIIADDGSTDATTTIDERIAGITVVRGGDNLGFLGNCNRAAKKARGEFLLFLNNDTVVTDGWLDALLEPLADPGVGATGPKLLFADGRLQEAGGIIWRDASGWNFGRADSPDKPAYNYRRDVDYVSGACLLTRRALWQQLGGFDERFSPAYYEDADYCFAVRAAGHRVVYQPRSVICHIEGVSNGTDLGGGVKQHQVENQQVFREKWQRELDAGHFPNGEEVIHARDRSAERPCVLVIDHYVPHHDKDAGGRSTWMYLRQLLAAGCRVQFMGANFFAHQPYTQALQDLGIEVLVGESIARDLDRWLTEHAPYIDEIIVHRPHVAEQFLPHLEGMRPRPPISFFGHDLHYLRFEREAAIKGDDSLRAEGERWRHRELAVCERVDRVYYFSAVEIEELATQLPAEKLRRIPLYAMELAALPPYAPEHRRDLLFVGGFNHPPNVDAALWLVDAILPTLRAALPEAHLHLVGSNPTPEVLALAGEAVTVHGYVSDGELTALYRRVGAAVVPLQYGAGVKGKIIEAIAHHVPLVTTDIGAEGIPEAERVLWIENTADAIARRLGAILSGGEVDLEARLARHEAWLTRHFDARVALDTLRADMPCLARAIARAA